MQTKLTPSEFANAFPDSQINRECLEDIACSRCGNRAKFSVIMTTAGELTEDGSDCNVSDHEYAPTSHCRCDKCNACGTVADFTIDGLDALLEAQQ